MLYRVHLAWVGFELTTLVVIGTDCIGSYKSMLPYDHDHDGCYVYVGLVKVYTIKKKILYQVFHKLYFFIQKPIIIVVIKISTGYLLNYKSGEKVI